MAEGHEETRTASAMAPTELDSVRGYTVVVIEGPETGQRFTVDGSNPSPALVGQSQVCDLRLSDPLVSRRHLSLTPQPNGLRLVDLRSTNGTFVDGVRCFDALLTGGELVRIGSTAMSVASVASAAQELPLAQNFGRLVGASPAMRRLYPVCERLAQSDVSVAIEGETGTGKEVLAEAIHEASARRSGPFVVFDCTAVPPTLVESELFGHERGAFTGAVGSRKGVFEQAHGGTLLIDEIGDLELTLQPKLLRALERSEIRRVGGDRWIKVDIRVLAATRRDLDRDVEEGRFRDDLFFRLAVARIELPPLRARSGDIELLTRHLWRQLEGIGEPPYALLRKLERQSWPGNVRELANAVARYLALGEAESQDAAAASTEQPVTEPGKSEELYSLPFRLARDRALAAFEREYVQRLLGRHGGNVTRAAEASGIGRRYLTTLASRQKKAP
jgi:two-component system, NtrC family, response regulator HydG